MAPGEFQDINLKHIPLKKFFKNYEQIDINVSYNDIYTDDEKIKENIQINTKEIQKVVENTTIVYQEEIIECN